VPFFEKQCNPDRLLAALTTMTRCVFKRVLTVAYSDTLYRQR